MERIGVGKTTTIKSILNITNAEGSIKLLGKDNKENGKETKEKVGAVLDDSFLYLIKETKSVFMEEITRQKNKGRHI